RTPQGIARIASTLEALHRRITAGAAQVLCAGLDGDAAELAAAITLPAPQPAPADDAMPFPALGADAVPAALAQSRALALHAPAQVNHCVMAWRVPALDHPDAPGLAVFGELV